MENSSSFARPNLIFAVFLFVSVFVVSGFAQEATPSPTPADEPKPAEKLTPISKDPSKPATAEQVVESSIFIYAMPSGRVTLNQIRKTVSERGKLSMVGDDGNMVRSTYQRYSLRGETSSTDRTRVDIETASTKYSLISDDGKIVGVFDGRTFAPLDSISDAFRDRGVYSIETLLRYKEDGSKIENKGKEKHLGVEYYLIELTDKDGRVMTFYVSTRTFRVMMLDYVSGGTNYRRKFYNYNYAQGTLVPFETVLYTGDKIVEETEIGTVTYGQKVDEGMFIVN